MGLLYREDLLKAASVEVPKTWPDFAAAAEKYHAANPKSYLANLAPNDPGHFVSYLWQIGARPVRLRRREDGHRQPGQRRGQAGRPVLE